MGQGHWIRDASGSYHHKTDEEHYTEGCFWSVVIAVILAGFFINAKCNAILHPNPDPASQVSEPPQYMPPYSAPVQTPPLLPPDPITGQQTNPNLSKSPGYVDDPITGQRTYFQEYPSGQAPLPGR